MDDVTEAKGTGGSVRDPEKVALDAIEVLWPDDEVRVEVLSGGLTNANFKVTRGGERFALRVQSQNAGVLDINREAEEAAARLAAAVGVAPEVVASLPERHVLVTRFVDGTTPEATAMRDPAMIERVGSLFRRLHAGEQSIPGNLDPFAVCRKYGEILRADGHDGGPVHAESDRIAARIEAAIDFTFDVPSHCDALAINFIDGSDGRLWLIDWEYAGMSHWTQDISDVSGYHDFELEDDRRLVAAYKGEAADADVSAIRVMRFMIMFRCALWGLVQQVHGDLDEDYGPWIEEWLAKAEEYGGSAEFREHLGLLEAATKVGS